MKYGWPGYRDVTGPVGAAVAVASLMRSTRETMSLLHCLSRSLMLLGCDIPMVASAVVVEDAGGFVMMVEVVVAAAVRTATIYCSWLACRCLDLTRMTTTVIVSRSRSRR